MPSRKLATVPSKISAPRLAATYERTRLFRALDRARRTTKAVWITAPAGAGKTCVVATYLRARRLPALWYNVDIRDADVAHVFHYLAMAARMTSPRRRIELPQFAIENQSGVSEFAGGFFEALFRQRPVRSAIVIDDYHEARADLWDEVVGRAIDALPKDIFAIIVSRGDPPAAMARSVVSGTLALLGTDDLRLTPRETGDLVRLQRPDLRGAKLKGSLPRIVELANGWAAALTLLLQSPGIETSDARSIDQFSERLFDYVATEIVDKATPSHRDFLLKTSVVPMLTEDLATCLTGTNGAARILLDLERRSFLTQRLGDSGAYRYHPLLRSFLLRRAEEDLGLEPVRELHRRAAEALVEIGQIDEAMEQFDRTKDAAAHTALLLRVAPSYVSLGRGRTIDLWIGRLPPEWVAANAWLLYWQAVCCLGYEHSRPRDLLERAYRHFSDQKDISGLYLTCATAIQAIMHEGNFSPLDPWLERYEALEASGLACPEPLQSVATTGRMIASIFRRMDAADHQKWTERALQVATSSPDVGHRIFSGGILAIYYAVFQNPARAATIIDMLRSSARNAESVIAKLTLLQAESLCAWVRGENRAALDLVREALAIATRTGAFAWNNFLQGVGVAAALGLDDLAAARELLPLLAETAQLRGGWAAGWYHFCAGWEAAVRGDAGRALEYAELSREGTEAEGPPFGRAIVGFARANALWAAGRSADAKAALEQTRQVATQIASSCVLYSCDLIESDFLWDEDRERAVECLRRGLKLAREHEYHNMYWWSRSTTTRIAVRALEHDIEPDHVRAGIRKHRLVPVETAAQLESWPWEYQFRALGAFALARPNEAGSRSQAAPARDENHAAPRGAPLRLLKAVIVLGGRNVREADLIDALWPDAEGDAGRRVFDTTLHRLRRQLGSDDVLRLSSGRLGLDPRRCWVDLWALEGLFAALERDVEKSSAGPPLVALARRLLGLYRGALLAEDDDTWLLRPRQKWAARFRRAVDRIGPLLERGGHFAEAAGLDDRARDGHPPSERPSPISLETPSRSASVARRANGTGGAEIPRPRRTHRTEPES